MSPHTTTKAVPKPANTSVSINVAEAASRALEQKQQEQDRLVRFLKAVAARSIPYDYNLWMRVHVCEQGNTWHAGGHFGNGRLAGGNGLGFSADAWQMGVKMAARRGVTLPSTGWKANIPQQMELAQAFLDATNGGPDCLKSVRR